MPALSQAAKRRANKINGKDFKKTFLISCESDVDAVERFILDMKKSRQTTSGEMPPVANDEVWSVADTGSTVTGANCNEVIFFRKCHWSSNERNGKVSSIQPLTAARLPMQANSR